MDENKNVKGYRCTVCGYEHHEGELPEDYACPICGVGKELFEPIEE